MARGRVPDMNRIRKERLAEEHIGKLACQWGKDNLGRSYYAVTLRDRSDNQHIVYKVYNASMPFTQTIRNGAEQYYRTHQPFLSQLGRNPTVQGLKRVERDLDMLLPKQK